MSCTPFQDLLLGEAIEGQPTEAALTEHLVGCEDCSLLQAELDELDSLAGGLPEIALPEGLAMDTLELVELTREVDALVELPVPAEVTADTLAAMAMELHLDALPEIPPPAELVARTEAAMDAELVGAAEGTPPAADDAPPPDNVVRGPWLRRATFGIAAVAAAAMTMVVVLPQDTEVDTSKLVERGLGERVPEVALKIAVDDGGRVERLSRTRVYDAGDTLYFRAQVDQPAWVSLVRVDDEGPVVIHTESLQPGERDLRLEGGPLAWRIEPGESSATYALFATNEAWEPEVLQRALQAAPAHDDICDLATEVGARCAATPVTVAAAPEGGTP